MNPTQKEIYEKTVKRLARKGIKDPTGQIIDLAEEIEQYRSKIEHLQAYIQGLPKPKKGRFAVRTAKRPFSFIPLNISLPAKCVQNRGTGSPGRSGFRCHPR